MVLRSNRQRFYDDVYYKYINRNVDVGNVKSVIYARVLERVSYIYIQGELRYKNKRDNALKTW